MAYAWELKRARSVRTYIALKRGGKEGENRCSRNRVEAE
jgi:hypothetical protein